MPDERLRETGPSYGSTTLYGYDTGFSSFGSCSGMVPVQLTFEVDNSYSYSWIKDRNTPRYFTKKAKGEILPVNPLSYHKVSLSRTPGRYSFDAYYNCQESNPCVDQLSVRNWEGYAGEIPWDMIKHHPDAHAVSMELAALARVGCTSQAKDKFVDVLSFLAQYKQTQSFVAQKILEVVDIIKDYKRALKRIDVASKSKLAADTELQVRYALFTIHYDIKGAIDSALAKGDARVRGRDLRSKVLNGVISGSLDRPIWTSSGPVVEYELNYTTVVTVKTSSIYSLRFPSVPHKANIAYTLWDTIPLSFVFDWFVNVGDWLTAKVPQPGFNFRVGSQTRTYVTSVTGITSFDYSTAVHRPAGGWLDCNGDPSPNDLVEGRFLNAPSISGFLEDGTREPFYESDIPWFPMLDVNVTPIRLLDALAILRQQVR